MSPMVMLMLYFYWMIMRHVLWWRWIVPIWLVVIRFVYFITLSYLYFGQSTMFFILTLSFYHYFKLCRMWIILNYPLCSQYHRKENYFYGKQYGLWWICSKRVLWCYQSDWWWKNLGIFWCLGFASLDR